MLSIDDRQHNEIAPWITLNQIPGLGNATLCQLLAKFGSSDAIFSASISQLREIVDDFIFGVWHDDCYMVKLKIQNRKN